MAAMDVIRLTPSQLSVDEAVQVVTHPSCGAVSVFLGTTRDNFEGKTVVRLEYEAYEPMAEKELNKLCAEMRQKWELHKIAIFHRLGHVPVKESSVIIAVSSAHRKESLEAVQYCIDQLKAVVPIWKKEMYAGDEGCWKANKECSWSSKKPDIS
ncbi:molybdopterin synthase catalytic subunit-like [Diadema setosum]|uniref:molybdopterin synthase catalytic subunit-like n=1 Tax=Diadema setosum TaxID=31175 RepID=UPI003B3BD93D